MPPVTQAGRRRVDNAARAVALAETQLRQVRDPQLRASIDIVCRVPARARGLLADELQRAAGRP